MALSFRHTKNLASGFEVSLLKNFKLHKSRLTVKFHIWKFHTCVELSACNVGNSMCDSDVKISAYLEQNYLRCHKSPRSAVLTSRPGTSYVLGFNLGLWPIVLDNFRGLIQSFFESAEIPISTSFGAVFPRKLKNSHQVAAINCMSVRHLFLCLLLFFFSFQVRETFLIWTFPPSLFLRIW
jgi:hypothetical protein